MLARLRCARLIWLTLVLYGLAMVQFGFAHRMAAASPARSLGIEIASFVLPDGSLPVLCTGAQTDAPALPSAAATLCDACVIADAPGLAVPDFALDPPSRHGLIRAEAPRRDLAPESVPTRLLPRGPPLFRIAVA